MKRIASFCVDHTKLPRGMYTAGGIGTHVSELEGPYFPGLRNRTYLRERDQRLCHHSGANLRYNQFLYVDFDRSG